MLIINVMEQRPQPRVPYTHKFNSYFGNLHVFRKIVSTFDYHSH